MSNRVRRFTIISASLVAALYVAGYFFPTSFTWGFHFLGFLPQGYLLGYGVLSLATVLIVPRESTQRAIARLAAFADRSPALFLLPVLALFIIIVLVFHQRVFLLGDNVVFIRAIESTFAEHHLPGAGNEPLAIYFFFALASLLKTTTLSTIIHTVMIGEILLGVAFIVCVFLIARLLMKESVPRLLAFLMLSSTSALQLFMGYPESYAVVLLALALFVGSAILYYQGKTTFPVVGLIYSLLLFTHLLTACLFPAVAYMAWHEYRARGLRPLLYAIGLGAVVFAIVLALFQFNIARLFPRTGQSHILSLTEAGADSFQAYTLFSPFHAIELGNAVILVGLPVVLLGGLFLMYRVKLYDLPSDIQFLLLSSLMALLTLSAVKFDLGMARDWDITAPYGFLLTLTMIAILYRHPLKFRDEAVSLIAAITLLHTLLWISFNSTIEPSIARAKVLMDPQFLSHEGTYQATYHLSMAYYTLGDTAAIGETWQSYHRSHPDELRAYPQLVRALLPTVRNGPSQLIALFEEWVAREPGNPTAKKEYADFCINAGNVYAGHAMSSEAEQFYRKAIRLNPRSALAHNNLGSVFELRGRIDAARNEYLIATQLDSTYSDCFWNLGRMYSQLGDPEQSLIAMQHAAALGDTSARELLRRNGLTWQ